MALPILETATYELTLPSADVVVKYRPFLVKEEKVLLQALESNDDVETEDSVSIAGQTRKFPKKQIDNASVTYGVRLFEVYPQTIGSIDFDYASENAITQVPITLNFRTWANLTIDQVNSAGVGKSEGDVPTIKASKDFGLFSGILGKLPPEFRRAGRDILQTTRRNLPIGRVTGGRLFPPFG